MKFRWFDQISDTPKLKFRLSDPSSVREAADISDEEQFVEAEGAPIASLIRHRFLRPRHSSFSSALPWYYYIYTANRSSLYWFISLIFFVTTDHYAKLYGLRRGWIFTRPNVRSYSFQSVFFLEVLVFTTFSFRYCVDFTGKCIFWSVSLTSLCSRKASN